MEEKAADEMEMAAEANEEREKAEKTAQGWIKLNSLIKNYINNFHCLLY